MTEFEDLIAECRQLPAEITGASEAIVFFVSSISGKLWTRDVSGRWRPTNANFITLKPQWKQARSLAVTLRGNPDEFETNGLLELKKDQNGYCAFRLESASQIADAMKFVQRAKTLFDRGRTRERKGQLTIG
ncbi:MAG: hypothetical protein K2P80_04620 [Beijerinckiaceae bacterium]|nr:hypothetical protein [Beijerinckiaceae bacterium]